MNWKANLRVFLLCIPVCGLTLHIDFSDIASISADFSRGSVHNGIPRLEKSWNENFPKFKHKTHKKSRHFGKSAIHLFANYSSSDGNLRREVHQVGKNRRRTANDLIRSNDILGPHFDPGLPTNFTAQTGKTAILSCRVINKGDTRISWIRLQDLHILTVDKYKYSTDERVSVVHNFYNNEWVLRIKAATLADAGKYECQISTKPVRSCIVHLSVIVPKADIVSRPDIYVHTGSLINLTCIVDHGTNYPVFIMWYHHNKIVNIEDRRRSVEILPHKDGLSISRLLVSEAENEDSGKYTCKPSNGEPSDVTLHILHGELRAAIQTNKASISLISGGFVPCVISLIISFCRFKHKLLLINV